MGNSHFVKNYQEDKKQSNKVDDKVDDKVNDNNDILDSNLENVTVNKDIDKNTIKSLENNNNNNNNNKNNNKNNIEIPDKSISWDLNNEVFLEEGSIFVCDECKKANKKIIKLNYEIGKLENDLFESNLINMEKNSDYENLIYDYENQIFDLKNKLKTTNFNLNYQKEINSELKINFKILKLKLREKIKCKKLLQLDLDNRITRRHSI